MCLYIETNGVGNIIDKKFDTRRTDAVRNLVTESDFFDILSLPLWVQLIATVARNRHKKRGKTMLPWFHYLPIVGTQLILVKYTYCIVRCGF